MSKQKLTQELNNYLTLLSSMANPPAQFIEDITYFKGLAQTASDAELKELQKQWDIVKPNDPALLAKIEAK